LQRKFQRRGRARAVVAVVVALVVGIGLMPGSSAIANARTSPASGTAGTAEIAAMTATAQTVPMSYAERMPPRPRPAAAPDPDPSAATPDGQDVFMLREDRKIHHSGRSCGTCAWSEWLPLPAGEFLAAPAVKVRLDRRLQVFAVGADGAMWTSVETSRGSDRWSAWQSLGGVLISQPAAVAVNVDSRLEVFAVGTDRALYRNAQTSVNSSTWTGWQTLGGILLSPPVAESNLGGHVEVFVVGTDHAIHRIRQNCALPLPTNCNSWSGWQTLGGSGFVAEAPEVVRHSQGPLEVVAVGADGLIRHNRQACGNGNSTCTTWSGWRSLPPGILISRPAAAYNNYMLQVFAVGTDNRVYRSRQTSILGFTWTGWEPLPGAGVTSPPVALPHMLLRRTTVFATGSEDRVQVSSQNADFSDTFTDWAELGRDDCAPKVWTGEKTFQPGESITGCKGDKYVFQTNGSFAYYDRNGQLAWETNTPHSPPGRMVFNGGPGGDGDLEIFNGNNQKLWEAGADAPNGRLEFDQINGLLAVYDDDGGKTEPAWAQFEAEKKKELETWRKMLDQLVRHVEERGCPPLPANTPDCMTQAEFGLLYGKAEDVIAELEKLVGGKPCTTARQLGEAVVGALVAYLAVKAKAKWVEQVVKTFGLATSGNALYQVVSNCWDKFEYMLRTMPVNWKVYGITHGMVSLGHLYKPAWAPEIVFIDLIDNTRTETDLNIIFEGDAGYVPYFGAGPDQDPTSFDWSQVLYRIII
jgi:hypothetical protein